MSTQPQPLSTENDLGEAIARLRAGKLVAIPTETVYGLAADACNDKAVAAIFDLKQRPAFNPLITHVSDVAMAQRYAEWNEQADALARHFWPGPLTLILPRKADCAISLLASAGGKSLAIRVPAHPLARALLEQFDGGISAPSANRSGKVSPTSAAHVASEFPDADLMILDGGKAAVGIESTVVDCCGDTPTILRPGSVSEADIRAAGIAVESFRSDASLRSPRSPGMLLSHYAPALPLRMNAKRASSDEALLCFGDAVIAGGKKRLNLSESGNLIEAAANLFASIRLLDTRDYTGIAVAPIPETGIGIAINDRLRRASHSGHE